MATAKSVPAEEPSEIQSLPINLGGLGRSEIDIQVETAKRYPRSVKKFRQQALELATLTPAIAQECYYTLPRKDRDGSQRTIEGPSARLAEIVASSWENCRYGARIVGETDEFVIAQGAFFDIERNTAVTFEVRRRITDRTGRRYSADMIGVTANAAASIALRNAVFKGVPKALWADIYEQARRVVRGDEKSLGSRRQSALDYFAKRGVAVDRICATLGVAGVEDIGLDELVSLRGIVTAIEDGETTIEQAFAAPAQTNEEAERSLRIQALALKLGLTTAQYHQLAGQHAGRLDELEKKLATELAERTQPQAPPPSEAPAAEEPAEADPPAPASASAPTAAPAQEPPQAAPASRARRAKAGPGFGF